MYCILAQLLDFPGAAVALTPSGRMVVINVTLEQSCQTKNLNWSKQ